MPHRDGREIANAILGRLLDRFEAKPNRRQRISEPGLRDSLLSDDLESFSTVLKEAEAEGGVTLIYGRHELRGHIERVVLQKPAVLYRLLGRQNSHERA